MRRLFVLALMLVAVPVAGCGSSDDDGGGDGASEAGTPAPAAAKASDFPSSKGKTLETLRQGLPEGPVLSPSTTASLQVGTNRVSFALFTLDKKQITDAQVALYTTNHDGSGARGPYVARWESMEVDPRYQSRTTASDPDSAKGVYVADVPLRRPGRQVITGVARIDGKLVQTSGFELPIAAKGADDRPPDVGDKAPVIHTETLEDVAGDAEKLSTRVPPAEELLKVDFAEVVGKKPIVLTFSTPLLCQSRVCGPVVDIVEEVRAETDADVAFIHQEIYNDNRVEAGFRPQLRPWRLATEPWTFVVDKAGRVSARLEGAFGVAELERAVEKVS